MALKCSRLLVILLALLAGCSLVPSTAPSPAFDHLPESDTLKRRLTFIPDDSASKQRSLIALIRLDDAQLRAVFLTPFGQRLTTLIHDAQGSRYEEGDVPQQAMQNALPVPAAWLASRLEWSLWPMQALEEAFADSAWSLAVVEDAREIRHQGKLVARITPAATDATREETVLLDDRQGEYRLRISPLEESTP